MSVEAEVERVLASPADFIDVAPNAIDHGRKITGLHRDSATDPRAAFVVVDGRYVSARWSGDAHAFAFTLNGIMRT